MKLKNLAELKRPEPEELILSLLPHEIFITDYAKAKAYKVNELVRRIHKSSYEWYGFTLGGRNDPEFIVDIGLPKNDENFHQYTGIGPENIAEYQESLPSHLVINGWIHSHGNLGYKQFSGTDERNHLTVLDYVTSFLRKPIGKKEVVIRGLELLVEDQANSEDIGRGNVTLVTDAPIRKARLFETVYGGFSYGIVIGDGGWSHQEIHYKKRGILTGQTFATKREARLSIVATGKVLTQLEIDDLGLEIAEKIKPNLSEIERIDVSGKA